MFLAKFRAWMDTHTDQVIIAGSLLLGCWLIAKSTYPITPESASWQQAS